ncbi:RNA polymerase sigma factor [Vallicoccus soli]|uniref:RNA polymerase sigma factor n=1 Tax=Vallicoccus soli TaxID=2339232 RepID=UPI00319E25F4
MTADTHAALVALVRDEGRRVMATLVRTTGSWELAEDAVQDAALRALETWSRDGIPAEPRAWLTLTARRRALDVLRREAARTGKQQEAVTLMDQRGTAEDLPGSVVRDDLLRLIFTCCHPALSPQTQVALALRTLAGLSTAETARALLVPEQVMAKRLTRAKQKIRDAAIPYRVPPDAELPARLRGVGATVYLMFNEGWAPGAGDTVVRPDLLDEAVRLARLLHELMPDEPTATGLLALLLLLDARRASRAGPDGSPLLLREQDRALWDRALVDEGMALLGDGLRRTPERPDPYVVQAAIAACHVLAPHPQATDWRAICSWYDVLLTVQDVPAVRLARAVALAERDGPAAGLAALEHVRGLERTAALHAARAELLLQCGHGPAAVAAYDRALALPASGPQAKHLQGRRAAAQAASQ